MRILLPVVLLAACGGGPKDWRDQPTESVSGTIKGHAYTIDLPKGMEKSKVDSEYSVDYDYHQDGRVYAPSVMIGWTDKKHTVDDAMKAHAGASEKQSQADGWAFAYENDSRKGQGDFLIDAEKFVGDGALTCHVRVFPMKKGGDGKELIKPAQTLCLSLKTK